MRIDGTYGPGITGLPPEKTPAPQGGKAGQAAIATGAPADLYVAQKELIAAATAAPGINRQAVAEARELLKSGKLDTPEAAQRAAESILDQGI
jgi:hypothetical protein